MTRKHIIYSALFSLIMPILSYVFKGKISDDIIITFWPGSVMLLATGENSSIADVIYYLSIAIGSNILLYMAIIFLFAKLKSINSK